RPPPLAREPHPCPPRASERLLHKVLRVLERSDHPVAVRPQLAPVAFEECGEGGLVGVHHQLRPRSPALLIGSGRQSPASSRDRPGGAHSGSEAPSAEPLVWRGAGRARSSRMTPALVSARACRHGVATVRMAPPFPGRITGG